MLEVSMLKLAIGVQEDDDSFAKETALGKEISVFKQKKSSATVAVSAAKDVGSWQYSTLVDVKVTVVPMFSSQYHILFTIVDLLLF